MDDDEVDPARLFLAALLRGCTLRRCFVIRAAYPHYDRSHADLINPHFTVPDGPITELSNLTPGQVSF